MNDNKPGHRPLRRPAAWLDQPLPRAKGAMDNWLLLSGGAIGLVVGIAGLFLDSRTSLVLGLGWALCFLVTWVVFLTSDRRLRHSAPPVSSAYVERLRQQAVVIAYRQRGIDVLLLAALIVLPLSVLLAIDASRRDGAALSSVAGFGLVSAAAVWLIVRACSTSYRDSRRQRFVAVGKAGLLHDTVEWKAFYL